MQSFQNIVKNIEHGYITLYRTTIEVKVTKYLNFRTIHRL